MNKQKFIKDYESPIQKSFDNWQPKTPPARQRNIDRVKIKADCKNLHYLVLVCGFKVGEIYNTINHVIEKADNNGYDVRLYSETLKKVIQLTAYDYDTI